MVIMYIEINSIYAAMYVANCTPALIAVEIYNSVLKILLMNMPLSSHVL